MFLHFPSDTSTNVITVTLLEGDVDPETVRAALPLLQSAWPMLNVHPERSGRRWWLSTDGTPGIDLQVRPREDDDHWQRVADELVNLVSVRDQGPLLRLVLLHRPGVGKVELLFVWDHLIADGVGPGMVTAELLSLIDRMASGERVASLAAHPLAPGVAELVAARFDRRARAAALARYLARSSGAQRRRRARTRSFPPLDADALATTGRTRHDIRVLEPAVTRRLLAAARSERATMTGALYGATVLAMRRERYAPGGSAFPMSGFVPVNLRSYLDPPVPDDVLGVYTSTILVRTDVAADSSLWEVARGYRADLDAALGQQLHLAAAPGAARMAAWVLPLGLKPLVDVEVSNLGAVDLPTGFRSFAWREMAGLIPATLTIADLSVSGATLDGRFPISFDYSTRFLSEAMATRVADRTIAMLTKAAEAG